jgi:hypothetical protein
VIDCVSEEDVQLPTELECRSRNEFDVFHGESELELVQNPLDDPLCQAFDGYPVTPAAEDGSASGLPAADDDDDGKKRRGMED